MKKKFLSGPEIAFFLIYLIGLPLLTAFQYSVDYKDRSYLLHTSTYLMISKILDLFPFIFFYKVIIPHTLFARKYLLFLIWLIAFMVAFDLYLHFFTDLFVAYLPIVPEEVNKMALNAYNRYHMPRQSIQYTFQNLLGITALAYFIRTLNKEKQVQELIRQQWKLELDALKNQLHPHFFFNTLNNIYSLALQRSALAAPVTRKLADMMRYMLYETSSPKVLLTSDVAFIENYIELEKLRLDSHIQISFDVQGDTSGMKIEPFLFLPFVENAFKHGVENEIKRGYVSIVLLIENDEIIFQAENSKPAIQEEKTSGVGLLNVKKRLEILYPAKHRLKASETSTTYHVFLSLSLS